MLYSPRGKRWVMTERNRARLDRSPHHLSIGPSALRWTGDSLVIDIDEWSSPLPMRLKGRVTLHPHSLGDVRYPIDLRNRHVWRPVAPCARVEVEFERPATSWSGHGYCDFNAGEEPLEKGFRRWMWSRTEEKGLTRILYDTETRGGERTGLALVHRADGSVEQFAPPPVETLPSTGWRIGRTTRSDPGSPARVLRTLEDTPFYARSLIASSIGGRTQRSMHESVDLDRFSTLWVRALLPFRMPRRI